MNLLSQFNAIFAENPKGFATVLGIRNDGVLIAQTPMGTTVLLEGKADIGKSVFYDKVENKVAGEAPNVTFNEYSV